MELQNQTADKIYRRNTIQRRIDYNLSRKSVLIKNIITNRLDNNKKDKFKGLDKIKKLKDSKKEKSEKKNNEENAEVKKENTIKKS